MRTKREIIERIGQVNDLLGIQVSDLVSLLPFEDARHYYMEPVAEEEHEQVTDLRAKILQYLPFAYEKAEDMRGLSAARSMLHFKTWIWALNDGFYEEVRPLIENYTNYGIPALDAISKRYK